jgi:cell wall-associated NlpC family hydrolase
MTYVRDLGSVDLWRYSEQRSQRRRAARARRRRMRRIGVPLAMLVSAAGTGAPAFAGTAKAGHSSRRTAARRHHQRILRLHSSGPDVVHLQRLLGVPADGVFGHQTLQAVRRFQRESGLLVDGQVGPITWAALERQNRGRPGEQILEVGSEGAAVAAVQRRLEIPADGIFGPVTLAAVESFQRTHGLVVDGQVGPFTLHALRGAGHWRAPRAHAAAPVHHRPRHHHHDRRHHHRHRPARLSLGERAVHTAEQYLGVPYVWGGESPSGFDCSGLVQYVYGKLGVHLPRTSYAQYDAGRHIGRGALEPGDLVFFDGLGHVGIYIGGGRFIHAPHTGTRVQIGTLAGWYDEHWAGATRVA